MKRLKTILIVSSFIIFEHSLAQELEFEAVFRPALTALRGNELIKKYLDPTINFSAGVGVNFFLPNNSVISLSVLYDRKGGGSEYYVELRDDQNQVIAQGMETLKSNFEYITLPIQWGRRFGKKIKYQYGIGIYTSYLLKQEQVGKGLGGLGDGSEDNTSTYKRLDLGLSAGFSIYVPITDQFSIKAGLDDNLGLLNVSSVPVANNGTIQHNSLGLVVGVNCKLK